ncbi:MAG: AbrB/MazE/SpoVT family DNA-binding domain-containing protein [Clostridia bacterium]|nr:AbrB/MazE/SpoVT family DNA-binding domain-containing protein [Clostridia bacterium]
MKATGIVRKIDELGRIVIPKEIRKSLRIREGDPLEMYTEKNGEIVLKKYAPMGDIMELSAVYADVLAKSTGCIVYITDNDTVIAVAGTSKKEYLDKHISDDIINIMGERALWTSKEGQIIPIVKDDEISKYYSQIVSPIICQADAIGTVILVSTDYKKEVGDVEIKLIQSASIFLGKQMEI